jgi:hypothetical protein
MGVDWSTSTLLELPSGFLLTFISLVIAAALFLPIAGLQRAAYGDSWTAALSKSALCCILTAIPTPLPGFVVAALGVAGGVELHHRRELETHHHDVN